MGKDIVVNVPSFLSRKKKKSRICSLPFIIISVTILIMILSLLAMNNIALSDNQEATKKWISQWNLLRKVALDTLYVYENIQTTTPKDNPPINWSIDYDDEFDDTNQIDVYKEKKKEEIYDVDKKKNEKLSERNDYHEIAASHPQYSPRDGTNITDDNKYIVLGCPHQSKCIGINNSYNTTLSYYESFQYLH